MAKFYNIYLNPKKEITEKQIEAKMNLSLDWIRYDTNCYLIYSNSDVKKWMVRLKPFVEPGGRLFISELNIQNRNGWMTKDFWNWIRKKR